MYVDSMCLFIRLMTSLARLNGSLTDIVTSRGQFCHLSVTKVHTLLHLFCKSSFVVGKFCFAVFTANQAGYCAGCLKLTCCQNIIQLATD